MPYQKNILFFGCLLITGLSTNAQDRIDLDGRVYSDNGDVAGTHIINQTTQRATITDINGFFTIPVRLNDTLVFSAVQYKRKQIVVTEIILNAEPVSVPLEEVLTELDEVVVMPYSLTGTLGKDLESINVEPVVTASTIGLLNKKIRLKPKGVGKVVKLGKYGRIAIGYDTITLRPKTKQALYLDEILKQLSGTNKALKKYAAIDEENILIEDLKKLYTESVFVEDLKIPEEKINDFMNFCAAETSFAELIGSANKISLWNFIKEMSIAYRKNNGLDR